MPDGGNLDMNELKRLSVASMAPVDFKKKKIVIPSDMKNEI